MYWKRLLDEFSEIFIYKGAKDKTKLVQVLRQVKGKNKTFPRHYWIKPEQVRDDDVVISNHDLLTKKHKALKKKSAPKNSTPLPEPEKPKRKKNSWATPLESGKARKVPSDVSSHTLPIELKKIKPKEKFESYNDVENNYLAELTRVRFELLNANHISDIGFEVSEDHSDLFNPDSMSDLLAVRDIKNSYLFFEYDKNGDKKIRALKVPSPINSAKSLNNKDSKNFLNKYKADPFLLGIEAKFLNDDISQIAVREADSNHDLPKIVPITDDSSEQYSKESSDWMDRWEHISTTDIFDKAMDYNLDHNLSDSEVNKYKEKLLDYFSPGTKINLINKNMNLFTSPARDFSDSDFHSINKSLKIDLFDRMGILFGGSDSDVSPEELKATLLEGDDEKFQKIKKVMREQSQDNPIDKAITSMNKISLKEIATGAIQSGNPLADQLKKYSKSIKNRDRVFNSFKTIDTANKAELWKALQKCDKERKLLHNMTVHAFGEKAYKNGWDGESVLELLGTTNGNKPDIESYLQIGNHIAKTKTPEHITGFGIEPKVQGESRFFIDSKKDDSLDSIKKYIGISKKIVEKDPSQGHTVKSLLKKYNKSLTEHSIKSIHFRDAFMRGNVSHQLSDMKRAKVESIVSQFVLDSFIRESSG